MIMLIHMPIMPYTSMGFSLFVKKEYYLCLLKFYYIYAYAYDILSIL